MSAKKALGRGLDALLSSARTLKTPASSQGTQAAGVTEISISDVKPNAMQPRRSFNTDKMEELIRSIKEKGIIQPVLVRQLPSGKYEIIAGERRYTAATRAGVKRLPVIIKNVNASEQYEMAVVENIMREDLNPVEEAMAYKHLMEMYHCTQEELAEKLGKKRETIANLLRMLRLPEAVLKYLRTGELSTGHAKVLLSIDDTNRQKAMCEHVVRKGISVRELESLLNNGKPASTARGKTPQKPAQPQLTAEMRSVLKEMKLKLGTKVDIKGTYNSGKIEIDYYSKEDFERILEVMRIKS